MLTMLTELALQLQDYVPSPIRVRISSIMGSISFACWLVLMIPQLVEQWRLKTVEGISPVFLLIWASGDVANFIGSFWAGLLPEVIIIALWFLFADIVTFLFYYYIGYIYKKPKHRKRNSVVIDEESLLLGEHAIHYEHEHIPEHERSLSNPHHTRRKSHASTLEDIVCEPQNHSIFTKYFLPLGFVVLAGIFGSLISPSAANNDTNNGTPGDDTLPIGPQICGYISAFLYLTARLPQMYHNYIKKSCKGLSLLFFLFTMLANVTYSLQILFYRNDWEYLKLNLSWLLGSAGTITQDLIIVTQFYLYRENR